MVPMVFFFDQRPMIAFESQLNILQTIYICIVLGFGAMFFSKDANDLVLNPIERMISKMERIRDNPLVAMRLGDEEFKVAEIERKRKQLSTQSNTAWSRIRRFARMVATCGREGKNQTQRTIMETVILEKTIIKLGGLLALGFGEAGAEIIGQNLSGKDTAGVNAMIPGQKVEAIFGFCDIRNFTDATEVLQDKVMMFVNRISEIVHSIVDEHMGAANKNIGDAFLLVWRLSGVLGVEDRSKMADLSVVAFLKVVAAVARSAVLAEYQEHPGLLARLPNYR